MPKPIKIPTRLEAALGRPCPYCGEVMRKKAGTANRQHWRHPTRDHVVPRCEGGTITVVVCHTCNHNKADRSLDEWLAFLAWTDDPRQHHVERFLWANKMLDFRRESGLEEAREPPAESWIISRGA
jgi:hypothetical protein